MLKAAVINEDFAGIKLRAWWSTETLALNPLSVADWQPESVSVETLRAVKAPWRRAGMPRFRDLASDASPGGYGSTRTQHAPKQVTYDTNNAVTHT